MLGKLIKHEWKATRRLLLPINLIIVLITLVGCIILSTDILHRKNSLSLAILLLILYILSIFVLASIVNIYLLVHFYKNLFTREGYLMFTLPVTQTQLLNSKLIVGYLWSILNAFICLLSIFALSFSGSYYALLHKDASEHSGTFLSGLSSFLSDGMQTTASFQEMFGHTPLQMLFLCIAVLFISSFCSLTMGYLAIVLGQLVEKHKLACSIGFYIALYIGIQIISSIVVVLVNIPTLLGSIDEPFEVSRSIYSSFLPTWSILSLILGILFYVITLLILRRKVNLD